MDEQSLIEHTFAPQTTDLGEVTDFNFANFVDECKARRDALPEVRPTWLDHLKRLLGSFDFRF